MKKLIILFFLLYICQSLSAQDMSKSIVTINVVSQDMDNYSPWQTSDSNSHVLNGCLLENNYILTLAHSLYNNIFIEVLKHGQAKKYRAKIICKDYDTGLAIIQVLNPSFYDDLIPLELIDENTNIERVKVAKWDAYGVLKTYQAETFKNSIQFYGYLGIALFHSMITGLEEGGNGEPVFQNGKLVGITSWYDEENNVIEVISSLNINKMLKDLKETPYEGIPFFWIGTNYINSDEYLRDYLGMSGEDSGVLVTSVPPQTSGHDVLKENDVILSIDGINIDDRGLFFSEQYGKLNYKGLIGLFHSVGDTVNMKIIREKEKMEISFSLVPINKDIFLIPTRYYNEKSYYIVTGGLIFQELTENYLRTWGSEWYKKADLRFINYDDYGWIFPTEDKSRIVILNRVLPAPINHGYQSMKNLILESINGISVKDLTDLYHTIQNIEDEFIEFKFEGKESIVLKKDEIEKSNPDIYQSYGINNPLYLGE